MSNYASQQMGLLRRLTGHKHRLEGQIKELKANREADRGGEETPERRRSSVGYDMSPRVSVGDGWHLDYSEADRECQRQDRAWLTQQKVILTHSGPRIPMFPSHSLCNYLTNGTSKDDPSIKLTCNY